MERGVKECVRALGLALTQSNTVWPWWLSTCVPKCWMDLHFLGFNVLFMMSTPGCHG